MSAGTDFQALVLSFSTDAKDLYGAAHHELPTPPTFPSVPDETQDVRLKRAQGMVSAGLQQVGQAAKMEAEQAGRDGYAGVAKLMGSVATTTDAICKRIQSIVGTGTTFPAISTDDYAVLKALNETLQMLGALSPAAVWAKQSDS